jgi:hypothetical protein
MRKQKRYETIKAPFGYHIVQYQYLLDKDGMPTQSLRVFYEKNTNHNTPPQAQK